MPSPNIVSIRGVGQLLRRVVADRLEHPVALVRATDETLLDERLQGVEIGVCNLRRGLERAAACEDGEAGEELLLRG